MGSRVLSPSEFLKVVRSGQHYEVLLLRGREEFLLRSALREYVDRNMAEDAAGFDYTELRAAEVNAELLWNALTTLPLMSPRRLVVLDVSKSGNDDVAEAITRYIERPSASTSLVMIRVTDRKGEGLGSFAGGNVVEVEFSELKAAERATWIREYIRQRGKTIDDEAVQYLIEISTSSIADINSKLDHAALFIGNENTITVQVLMKVAGISSEYTIFHLENAILKQSSKEAHQIALSLINGGESVLGLMILHRKTVFRLWQISRAIRKPQIWQSSDEGREAWNRIEQGMGRQAFKLNDYKAAARKIGEEHLRDAVVGLVELEAAAKSGTHETIRYFEWLWKLTSSRRNSIGTSVQTSELTG